MQKQEQIAALAHDIKTPLTIIRGNAELMQETESIEEIREWDQEILDNAAELERYLEVLQETIRVSDGESKLRKSRLTIRQQILGQVCYEYPGMNLKSSGNRALEERFSTGPFLEEVRKKADALGRLKNLKIDCSFPLDEFMIRGRTGFREELIRAMGNILSNGVDYCPEEVCSRSMRNSSRQGSFSASRSRTADRDFQKKPFDTERNSSIRRIRAAQEEALWDGTLHRTVCNWKKTVECWSIETAERGEERFGYIFPA